MSDVTEKKVVEPYWGVHGYVNSIEKHWKETESGKNGWALGLSNPAPTAHGTPYGFQIRIEKVVDPITHHGYKTKAFMCVVDMYPACCAFKQLNHFQYGFGITEEDVSSLLDDLFDTFSNSYEMMRKIVINTVERQCDDNYYSSGRTYDQSVITNEKQYSGDVFYPFVHRWAKKQKGCIDTPVINQNTGRIIHHMIVFPDVTNS